MKKRENILMGVGIILLVISIVGVSYAAFSYTGAGSKLNTITTGIISMSYTESDNVISMDKALPTTDDTGKVRLRDGEYFDFTVESTIEGNAIINYEVAAEALSSNTFDGRNVKLYLTRINGTTEEAIMLPKLYIPRTTENTKTGRPEGMLSLTTGSMGASETIKYRLRMYVKEGYNPQDDNGNEIFQVKINVYGKVAEEPTGTLIKAANYVAPVSATVNEDNYAVPMTAEYLASEESFQDSDYKYDTTSIVTKDNNIIPETAVASWDISEAGDGKAVAYYEDDGTGAGTYKLTLGGEGGLLANPNMNGYFLNFNSVQTMDLTHLNTSMVISMQEMFAYCSSLTSLDLSNFDTSNVISMSGMLQYCEATTIDLSSFDFFNVIYSDMMFSGFSTTTLDLSSFDTSNVTDMSNMFSHCSATTIDLSSFDTSNVTNMYYMFSYCSVENLDLSNLDTSNVISMDSMFRSSSITTLDLSNLDTSNVINMSGMFSEASITTLDLSSFDTSNVTNISFMFFGNFNLTTLDLSSFDTSNVTNMSSMFSGCSSLTTLDLTNFNTSNVTSIASMFSGCSSLTTLDLTSFDTSNVTTMSYMFQNATKLTSIQVSNKWVIGSSTYVDYMFRNCGTDHVTYV